MPNVAPPLVVDEHDAHEEGGEDHHREVYIVAQRHDPRREGGADVGSHDDRDGLRKREETRIDKRNCHYRSG